MSAETAAVVQHRQRPAAGTQLLALVVRGRSGCSLHTMTGVARPARILQVTKWFAR